MSDFDEMFSDGFDSLVDSMAEPISYTALGASAATEIQRAIVSEERVVEIGSRDGRRQIVTRQVTVTVDPDSPYYCGVPAPTRQATVTIGTVGYYVDEVMRGETDSVVVLVLRRVSQVQKSSEHMELRRR